MDGLTARDRVGRLRVQRPSGLPLGDPALRLRVERHIDALDLRPARLPNGAVLIVRRLSMRMNVGASHAPMAGRVLDDLLARAARPALAPAPQTAPAVLFADVAELLACLTCDALHGRMDDRWYCRQSAARVLGDGAPALGAIWQQHAYAAPAALRLLAAPERRALATTLGDAGCRMLARAMAAAFAVEVPAPVARPGDAQPARPVPAGTPDHARAGGAAGLYPVAPWQPWVGPAEFDGLAPAGVLLLGFGLVLAHAPAYARSAAFQQSAARWLGAAMALQDHALPDPGSGQAEHGAPALPVAGATQPAAEPAPAQQQTDATSRPTGTQGTDAQAATLPQAQAQEQAGTAASARAQPRRSPEPRLAVLDTVEGTESGLAGLLYLINLMRWLDLPAAAHAVELDARLGAWAMLDMLARLLLPGESSRSSMDPLWGCLAELDGRASGYVIGAGLRRPAAFRLPETWVQRWLPVDRPWMAASLRGRLRIADLARGVLIVDVPLAGRSVDVVVAAEIERYRLAGVDARAAPVASVHLAYLPASVRTAVAPGPAWWLRRVNGFIRYVLARQVRCAPDEVAAVMAGLCRRRARVTISRTHVDLYLPIEQIDMTARRSGLDQDPGWAPDFGRIITFHFA